MTLSIITSSASVSHQSSMNDSPRPIEASVAREDLKRLARSQSDLQLREEIEEFRVDSADLVRVMIAEHPIYVAQRLRDIFAIVPIDSIDALAGVEVVESE